MPGRPWLMFLYLYIVRRGFLDGLPGFDYSRMRAAYELMIDAKVRELRWQRTHEKSAPAAKAAAGSEQPAAQQLR